MDTSVAAATSEQLTVDSQIRRLKKEHVRELESLAVTKRPLATLKYFTIAVFQQVGRLWRHASAHRLPFSLIAFFCITVGTTLYVVDGPHKLVQYTSAFARPLVIVYGGTTPKVGFEPVNITKLLFTITSLLGVNTYMKEALAWARYVVWWIALGVLSSIGLGSGLHTFLLYLGPHVAMFTMRATQCGRVDFKSAPYDTPQWGLASSWVLKDCSQLGPPVYPLLASQSERFMVPLHTVLLQVQLEAVLWGVGTALGELPPYFMSRAARLSGERLREVEELVSADEVSNTTTLERLKLWMINHFENFGFFTILLFASVPNPLFDLAGILCGQFLVPFWKFFAATLIGKAIIKTHIQTIFIIMVCNPYILELIGTGLAWVIHHLPAFAYFTPRITASLESAKSKFHNVNSTTAKVPKGSVVALAWNSVVFLMMVGFASSIVTSVAQGVLMERHSRELKALEARQHVLSPTPLSRHEQNDQ